MLNAGRTDLMPLLKRWTNQFTPSSWYSRSSPFMMILGCFCSLRCLGSFETSLWADEMSFSSCKCIS
jgi:hypothetical protein